MAKLQRKSAKLFAENATAAAGGIAQFGSLAAGTPNYSTDPDVIQGLSQYSDGWSAAVLGTKSPALEDRNALDYLLSYQQAYIMQRGVPEWLDTETYYENSYVVDSDGYLRISLSDNNIGHDPAEDPGGTYWGFAGNGVGKNVGEVFWSQSSDPAENPGALPLFTGETISNADQVYPDFYTWVNTHTELQISAADYETALSTYGECPKYVIDTVNKTIRLPKLTNYIKAANLTDKITQSDAGLPNVTGSVRTSFLLDIEPNQPTSALQGSIVGSPQQLGSGGAGSKGNNLLLDLSTNNSIYGNSNTVTPAHTTLYPWVAVFNAAVPASTAQAAQFQAALTSKVDLASGVSQNDVDYVISSYSNGTSWYRIYKSGWCEQGGLVTSGTGQQTVALLVTMNDTNYSVSVTDVGISSNSQYFAPHVYDVSTTSFKKNQFDNFFAPFYWEVKGQKAA